jgi:hypothetical protein
MIRQRSRRARRRSMDPDVGRAAVARLADDVGERPCHLPADHRLGRRDAAVKLPALRSVCGPRARVGRTVRAVRHIHAAGRTDQDCVVARRLLVIRTGWTVCSPRTRCPGMNGRLGQIGVVNRAWFDCRTSAASGAELRSRHGVSTILRIHPMRAFHLPRLRLSILFVIQNSLSTIASPPMPP